MNLIKFLTNTVQATGTGGFRVVNTLTNSNLLMFNAYFGGRKFWLQGAFWFRKVPIIDLIFLLHAVKRTKWNTVWGKCITKTTFCMQRKNPQYIGRGPVPRPYYGRLHLFFQTARCKRTAGRNLKGLCHQFRSFCK
jgi:hypothetical protein